MHDNCLAKVSKFPTNSYQLLGITCIYIASKYCMIYPPPVSYFTSVMNPSKKIIYLFHYHKYFSNIFNYTNLKSQ